MTIAALPALRRASAPPGGLPSDQLLVSSGSRGPQGGQMAQVLGIDIGGTGIKAAPVDVATGKLTAERKKLDTPHPAKPDPVAAVVQELVTAFAWTGPIGATFPGVVTSGTIQS